ncbi:MAG: alpha/beta fold hydrolase [Clostridia bacterium]|nr:alpha/beta fold hydrolase [Clostridia bacterium]
MSYACENTKQKRLSKGKIILITLLCVFIVLPILLTPLSTAIVYESIFAGRSQTPSYLQLDATDFEGLTSVRSDFLATDGTSLAGFKYSKQNTDPKGLIVISHGLGDGGHNKFIPYINEFTENGFLVFAYDAHGSDHSQGDSKEGLPQGILDLDSALNHVKTVDEYKGLPVCILGHSWGAYSGGAVLSSHPEVVGAVLVAGFNESEDMLLYQSSRYIGPLANMLLFTVELYEEMKFGRDVCSLSCVESIKGSQAQVLIIHSQDDTTVPTQYGYDKYKSSLSDKENVSFLLFEDKGHTSLFFSEKALSYRQAIEKEAQGQDYYDYMEKHLDPVKYYEPSDRLLNTLLNHFTEVCK